MGEGGPLMASFFLRKKDTIILPPSPIQSQWEFCFLDVENITYFLG